VRCQRKGGCGLFEREGGFRGALPPRAGTGLPYQWAGVSASLKMLCTMQHMCLKWSNNHCCVLLQPISHEGELRLQRNVEEHDGRGEGSSPSTL
jgi:hypothetical protein